MLVPTNDNWLSDLTLMRAEARRSDAGSDLFIGSFGRGIKEKKGEAQIGN